MEEVLEPKPISDTEYVTNAINLWINNKPKEAIEYLEERKNDVVIAHGLVLLNFIVSILSSFFFCVLSFCLDLSITECSHLI